jgi:hypothetical protein
MSSVPVQNRGSRYQLSTANVLRSVFILLMALLVLRVCMPQNETLWTVYDTPGDAIRLILGLGVCAFLLVQLFRPPHDAHNERIWRYIGTVGIPLGVLCAACIW